MREKHFKIYTDMNWLQDYEGCLFLHLSLNFSAMNSYFLYNEVNEYCVRVRTI